MADGVREPDEGVNAAETTSLGEAGSGRQTDAAGTPGDSAALTSVSVREPDEAALRRGGGGVSADARSRDATTPALSASVREPDEATIRAELETRGRSALPALAALDRLVAERDKANASRDRWRDYYTEEVASSTQTFDDLTAAEAEVAVLTARLEAAEKQRCDYDCNRFEGGL